MRDLNVGLLRGRRGPGGVRREGRGLGTVGFGLRGRRGRCEGSRQLLIKGQHGGGLYDLGAIRQSTLGASSWLLGKDRKSTRLNSSHGYISYAVFCLKKKKKKQDQTHMQE